MHGKGTLEVSLACLTRPYYVQGAPREEKGPNQFREKLGGLRLLTGLALYKALGKMFCRLNCLVCTAYPISPASTGGETHPLPAHSEKAEGLEPIHGQCLY